MIGYLEFFCGVVALLLALYYYCVSNFDFWKKCGVAAPKPELFFGNLKSIIIAKMNIANLTQDLYQAYRKEPVLGVYDGRTPLLILHDPEIIKTILIRDFSMFADRALYANERTEPMSLNLFQLDAERWRLIRPKLTPMFTTGKMKGIFTLMVECSKNLEKYLATLIDQGELVEVRELTANYTIDVIGSCIFGINMNAMGKEESEFRRVSRLIFQPTMENVLRLKVRLFCPKIYDFFGSIMPERKIARFFTRIISEIIEHRKQHGVFRPDFINMLMELKDHPEKIDGLDLTDTLLTAQAYIFFAAGFETSSTAMSFALYELAQNHDIQDKLREDINVYYDTHGDHFDYESVGNLSYLDKVVKETLRKFPAGSIIQRKSCCAYTFDTLKFTIPKDTKIWVPTYAIQQDPDIYPDPEKFDPERFTEEAIALRHPMHYLPFGAGPRNCIGARFADFQSKLGLIKILRHYKVDVCEKTMIPCEFDPGTFLMMPKGGLYLKITKIK